MHLIQVYTISAMSIILCMIPMCLLAALSTISPLGKYKSSIGLRWYLFGGRKLGLSIDRGSFGLDFLHSLVDMMDELFKINFSIIIEVDLANHLIELFTRTLLIYD
jgi:hypothetical protein